MTEPARLAGLDAIEAAVWQELRRAANDRHHEWRTPVLATVQAGAPDARTVVLREVDADARALLIYTDARAAKAAQLRAVPQAVLVLWSKRLGWQLRCRVHCEVEDEGLAVASRWTKIRLSPAAQDYLSPLPPGSALDAPAPQALPRENFAVITATVGEIDWLELHRARRWPGALGAALKRRHRSPVSAA